MTRLNCMFLTVFFLVSMLFSSIYAAEQLDEGFLTPLLGWHVLRDDYDSNHYLDFISYEWEYYMVHDHDGRFVGIIGYVICNPREKMGSFAQVVPGGGSIAVVGEVDGKDAWAEYIHFGYDNFVASGEEKYFHAEDPETGFFATLTPLPGGGINGQDALRLEGKTETLEWDLVVTQAWTNLNSLRHGEDGPFTIVRGPDAGRLPGEVWTLDALWPRTRLDGFVKVRKNDEVIPLENAKGYRENSWGKYVLAADGWDFLVYSDHTESDEEEGVLMVMQTYHHSKQLDFVDISFFDNGELVAERFRPTRGEVGWYHPTWKFLRDPHQCVPMDSYIVAENDEYRVEVNVEIGSHQAAILSDAVIGTRPYFIQEHFPHVKGKVIRVSNGEVITTFEGQAGGEFALHKSPFPWRSSFGCNIWGDWHFSHSFPEDN